MSEKDEEMAVEGNSKEANEPQEGSHTEDNSNASSDQAVAGEPEEVQEQAEEIDPIQKLEQEVQSEKDKYMRLYAEFENFRRRSAKERLELISSATGDLMKEILPVLDDFDRAIESNQKVEDINAVKNGFELLHTKLYRLLSNKGLKPLESKGKDFDPEFHEAVAQIPAPSKKEKGKVIDVVEKGYELNERILRHPKVVVGQ